MEEVGTIFCTDQRVQFLVQKVRKRGVFVHVVGLRFGLHFLWFWDILASEVHPKAYQKKEAAFEGESD